MPAGTGEYRIEQVIHPRRLAENCERIYVNLDFRVAATEAGEQGHHRFVLGAVDAAPVVEVMISAGAVSLRIGENTESLGGLKPNEWHNLQLTLDLKGRAISGKLETPGSPIEFSGKPIASNWSGVLDLVAFDSGGQSEPRRPAIELDNLGIQETSIPSVSLQAAVVATTTVEPDPATLAADVEKSKQELDALLAEGPLAMTYGMAEGTPHDVRIQLRGEPDQPGPLVPRGFIKVLGGGPLPAGTLGSGRLELARWLTRPDNPLTARVMVNRIWQYHFGRGLVKTPNDFGVRGLPPTHPDLLDHLASQFIHSGWSVKSMHRLIMLSATYQQASRCDTPGPAALGADSLELYDSFPRRRLSAEEIRDSILAVSGELDSTPAREHPFPTPVNWSYTQHSPFNAVYDHNKRSVYLMAQRLKRHPFLALFDGADPNTTTAERMTTTVPTQALFFLNDPFVHDKAEKWAARLLAATPSEDQRIDRAWRQAFGRSPTGIEHAEATKFLAAYRAELAAAQMDRVEPRALAAYLRTLIGSNAFLHVD